MACDARTTRDPRVMRMSHHSGLRGALAHDHSTLPCPHRRALVSTPARQAFRPKAPSSACWVAVPEVLRPLPSRPSRRLPESTRAPASGPLARGRAFFLWKVLRIGRIEDSYLRPV